VAAEEKPQGQDAGFAPLIPAEANLESERSDPSSTQLIVYW